MPVYRMGKNFHQFYFGDALMDPCITESRRQSRCYAVLLFRNCQLTMTFNAYVTVLDICRLFKVF